MIYRAEHKKGYTVIDNAVIFNDELSPSARFLLVFCLSKPNDWNFSVRGLSEELGLSKNTVAKLANELEAAGHLKRIRTRYKQGKQFARGWWDIYESPKN